MQKRIHYSWVICSLCLLLTICNMSLCSNIIAVYLPFIEATGISGALGSGIISVRCAATCFATLFVSTFYDRFRIKPGLIVATLLSALSAFVFSFGGSIVTYYAGAVIGGVAYAFGAVFPVSLLVDNWFHTHKGFALGFSSMGSGIGTVVFSPVITSISLHHGIRSAYLVQMAFVLLCVLMLLIFIKEKPEDKTLKPYGYDPELPQAVSEISEQKEEKNDEISKKVWILWAIMMTLSGGAGVAACCHISVLTSTSGFSITTAGTAVTVFGLALMLGKVCFGAVVDKIGSKKASTIFMLLFASACIATVFFNGKNIGVLFAVLFVMGFFSSFFNVGLQIWPKLFSTQSLYKDTLKWFQLFYAIGGILFTSMPGWIADSTGEYKSSFVLIGGMVLIMLVLVRREHIRAGFSAAKE